MPRDLATYMVVVALATSSSTIAPSSGNVATPALALSVKPRPSVSQTISPSAARRRLSQVGLSVAGLGQHQQELVGAVAAGEVAVAQQGAQLVGPLAQHGVAARLAHRLVDRGEAVDVEHDEGDRTLVTARAGQLEAGVLAQMAEVVHAGQRVARLGIAVVAHQAQVLECDVGLVGEPDISRRCTSRCEPSSA